VVEDIATAKNRAVMACRAAFVRAGGEWRRRGRGGGMGRGAVSGVQEWRDMYDKEIVSGRELHLTWWLVGPAMWSPKR
jgi:hypothetical protein